MRTLVALGAITIAACSVSVQNVPAPQPSSAEPATATPPMVHADDQLRALFDAQWEMWLEQNPEMATYLGDSRYADRLTDTSWEAIQERNELVRQAVEQIRQIDRDALSPEEQLNYDLYVNGLQSQIDGMRFPGEYLAINQMGGAHQSMAQLAAITPKRTVQDVENFIARLRGVPKVIDDTIDLLERGIASGVTPPRVTLVQVENLIAAQTPEDPTQSPIYAVYFANLPDTLGEDRARLQREGARVIEEDVIPAYRKLLRFWKDEYYDRTRESIGLSDLPEGLDWYNYNIRQMTTTDLTAEEIHEIGLREVRRIRSEMERVKDESGFDGSLEEFFEFLRTDEQFYYTEKEDLLRGYRDIAKRADARLPELFGTIPRLPYGVEPVPAYSEKTQTTAYYQPGSLEAGRPGTFFANTYNLSARPKWEMEALTLHEGVPGHHFQIAIAQELGEVPNFRKYGFGYTAFVEGWGLYSESLGEEMGFYKDPYSKFGQLTYEMWRAIRLVVDTGMHAKGWTRQQAIDFFKENAGKAEHDITVEVDRYIVWPGQALAYKIGELKIKELRARAEAELGEDFDIREFHDTVLGAGAIPLSLLEDRVDDWIASRRG